MLKSMIALSAAFAISVSFGAAAPLTGSLSIEETTEKRTSKKVDGVLGFLIKQTSMSLTTAITSLTAATPEETDEPPYSYAKKDECEAEAATKDEDSEPEQSAKKDPVGPEPIYFGF
ncbi:MAG: hypothetical protein DHS20C05_17720 [Hyphococcus sp.]|nr:MAG: hypothetical protein DHS20C05_17720 [Marinicaulis sp.]